MSTDTFQMKLDRALNAGGYTDRQADPLSAEMAIMSKAIHEAIAERLAGIAYFAKTSPMASDAGEWPALCRIIAMILIRELRVLIKSGAVETASDDYIDNVLARIAIRGCEDVRGARELGAKLRKTMG